MRMSKNWKDKNFAPDERRKRKSTTDISVFFKFITVKMNAQPENFRDSSTHIEYEYVQLWASTGIKHASKNRMNFHQNLAIRERNRLHLQNTGPPCSILVGGHSFFLRFYRVFVCFFFVTWASTDTYNTDAKKMCFLRGLVWSAKTPESAVNRAFRIRNFWRADEVFFSGHDNLHSFPHVTRFFKKLARSVAK